MPRISAGLLMYRFRDEQLQVLLVHPGGPFWKNKDAGAWSIPKGELAEGEEPLTTAQREFQEELGLTPTGPYLELGQIKQKAGKIIHAWAFQGDCDPAAIKSNTMKLQYPPKSGKWITVPEVDRADFLTIEEARAKINPAQAELLERLKEAVDR